MKIILPAALVALCLMGTACNTSSTKVQENESSLKTKIENCNNSDSLDMYISQAKAYADSLAREGKTDEARRYVDELTPVIDKHAPSLKEQWNAAREAVGAVAREAADSIGSKASAAADSLKSKGEAVKDAVADKTTEVTEKAADAVKGATAKTVDAVKKGSDEVKEAANNVIDKLKK